MGLFDKKELVCPKCGKTFFQRVNLTEGLCDVCWEQEEKERNSLEKGLGGYVAYRKALLMKPFTSDELREIIDRRENLIDKYTNENGISRAGLRNANDNCKQLTEEQIQDVLLRVGSASVSSTMGAAFSEHFFLPTQYEGVIVDVEDVFAVAFTHDVKVEARSSEVILCAVFTNDPAVPVFPMIYIGKMNLFEVFKSKKGRADVAELFEELCPNLSYPVGDVSKFKKLVKQEGAVRGNVEEKFVLNQIRDLTVGAGLFNSKKMHSNLYPGSETILDRMGYVCDDEICKILKLDRTFNNFWKKRIDAMLK